MTFFLLLWFKVAIIVRFLNLFKSIIRCIYFHLIFLKKKCFFLFKTFILIYNPNEPYCDLLHFLIIPFMTLMTRTYEKFCFFCIKIMIRTQLWCLLNTCNYLIILCKVVYPYILEHLYSFLTFKNRVFWVYEYRGNCGYRNLKLSPFSIK